MIKVSFNEGDWVILFSEPIHEGPHPDDEFTVAPVAKVTQVIRHPNNPDWITEYVVQEPTDDNASGLGDPDLIKPGKIHRLATFQDGFKAGQAYARTGTADA